MNIINIYDYNSYFNADLKAIFEHCSKIAFKSGYKLYLIGGIVRDLLLNQKNLDIDITVEGDAVEFARILEKKADARILSIHQNFGTIKVEINGKNIDFASTRSEIYPKKGHLPLVEKIGCSLEEDVLRRDFTINSLAISLNQENFAHLIDYVGGLDDLKARKIKVLHDKSFIDDPTRIIRALKYSARLGFELDKNTLKLQKEYLQNINYDMSYKRVKQEFKKTFTEGSGKTFDKFIEQGIYKLITSNNRITHHAELVSASYQHATQERSRNKFGMTSGRDIEKLIKKYNPKCPWLVYLGIICMHENENLLNKLELTKNEKSIIEGAKSLKDKTLTNGFEIYKAFGAQKLETLLILAVLGRKEQIANYLENLQKIKLSISGNDILKLGFTPSKLFSEGLDYVLKEKLKKPEMKKSEELELLKKFLT